MSEAKLTVPADLPDVSAFIPAKTIPTGAGWSLIIKMMEPKTKSKGGVILSDVSKDAQEYLQYCGEVIAMGPMCYQHPKFGDGGPWCAVGDHIVFGQHAGIPCVCDGVRYRILDDDQVKAKVDNPEALRVYIS